MGHVPPLPPVGCLDKDSVTVQHKISLLLENVSIKKKISCDSVVPSSSLFNASFQDHSGPPSTSGGLDTSRTISSTSTGPLYELNHFNKTTLKTSQSGLLNELSSIQDTAGNWPAPDSKDSMDLEALMLLLEKDEDLTEIMGSDPKERTGNFFITVFPRIAPSLSKEDEPHNATPLGSIKEGSNTLLSNNQVNMSDALVRPPPRSQTKDGRVNEKAGSPPKELFERSPNFTFMSDDDFSTWIKKERSEFIPFSSSFLQSIHPKEKNFVHNLSNYPLSSGERCILNKGLTFCLQPLQDNKKLMLELREDNRVRMDRKLFFRGRQQPTVPFKKFHVPSGFSPPTETYARPYVRKVLGAVRVRNKRKKTEGRRDPCPPNISIEEHKALLDLSTNPDVVIKKADKGSSIVLMNKEDYTKSCLTQLNNGKFYKPITESRSSRNGKAISRTFKGMYARKEIDKKTLDFLLKERELSERYFYGLPKIHKGRDKWMHNIPPLRPIISDTNSESYLAAKFVDTYLRPVGSLHPSFIQDTWHFMFKLGHIIAPKEALLVSLDVESLYTNIPLKEGISLCKEALNARGPGALPPTKSLISLLSIQAYNNDFSFGHLRFLQSHGVAMGRCWAPAFADIFMAHWEKSLFQHCASLNISIPEELWFRFLDDIFIIWPFSHQELLSFLEVANSWHPNIKLTSTISESQVDFLDLTIFKGPRFAKEGIFDTRSFRKETDTMQYLHPKSFHPIEVHTSLIQGLLLRLQRLNSDKEGFIKGCSELFQALLDRGYERQRCMALFVGYIKAMVGLGLSSYWKHKKDKRRVPLIVPYSDWNRSLPFKGRRIFRSFIASLQDQFLAQEATKSLGGPPLVAFRRPKNLKDMLVRGKVNLREGLLPIPGRDRSLNDCS